MHKQRLKKGVPENDLYKDSTVRISVREMAVLMDASDMWVREHIAMGDFPFASCASQEGGKRTFYIFRNPFYEYLGINKREAKAILEKRERDREKILYPEKEEARKKLQEAARRDIRKIKESACCKEPEEREGET